MYVTDTINAGNHHLIWCPLQQTQTPSHKLQYTHYHCINTFNHKCFFWCTYNILSSVVECTSGAPIPY